MSRKVDLVLICRKCRVVAPYPAPGHDGHYPAFVVRRSDRAWALGRLA